MSEVKRALEALILVADEPAAPRLLAELLEVSTETEIGRASCRERV